MQYANGTLADLTAKINKAIKALFLSIALADGTLASAVSQLNELLIVLGSNVSLATGTLANATDTYNALVDENRRALPVWDAVTQSYSLAEKTHPKDRIDVEIGDSQDASVFHPQMKMMRWDNEANVSLSLIHI